MAHDQLFDSAWFKWAQAIRHTQTLNAEIGSVGGSGQTQPVLTARAEYQPKRHGFAVFIEQIDPVPMLWHLLLGDIANNYRSAIEHLAWAIVTRGRTPPDTLNSKARKTIGFPISEHRNGFNGAVDRKNSQSCMLPGARRADVAKVRRRQPYHRGASVRPRHPFMLLADINNRDKHRTVSPIWTQPTQVGMEITYQQDAVVPARTNRLNPDALDTGTELTLIRARKMGPEPHIEVQPHVTAKPTVGHRVSIDEWAAVCGIAIFGLLREFSDQPAGIDKIATLGPFRT